MCNSQTSRNEQVPKGIHGRLLEKYEVRQEPGFEAALRKMQCCFLQKLFYHLQPVSKMWAAFAVIPAIHLKKVLCFPDFIIFLKKLTVKLWNPYKHLIPS